jgi:AraC-like DNA-binding protein
MTLPVSHAIKTKTVIFEKVTPSPHLQEYVRYFVISENSAASQYKVFPSTGLVMGFQYRGQLSISTAETGIKTDLASSGITGLADSFKVFSNSAGIGTILVYFTESVLAHFTSTPSHELFNLSVSIEEIFDRQKVREVEDKLASSSTTRQRISMVEHFLLSQLRDVRTDHLIIEAVKRIRESNGIIRISELNKQLNISQSPFEKRFRKLVGTTPKKFVSIVRFNSVLAQINGTRSLMDICFENNFFDQAHFSKDFKAFTGEAPEVFKRLL